MQSFVLRKGFLLRVFVNPRPLWEGRGIIRWRIAYVSIYWLSWL
jgi:hypothetical protein